MFNSLIGNMYQNNDGSFPKSAQLYFGFHPRIVCVVRGMKAENLSGTINQQLCDSKLNIVLSRHNWSELNNRKRPQVLYVWIWSNHRRLECFFPVPDTTRLIEIFLAHWLGEAIFEEIWARAQKKSWHLAANGTPVPQVGGGGGWDGVPCEW